LLANAVGHSTGVLPWINPIPPQNPGDGVGARVARIPCCRGACQARSQDIAVTYRRDAPPIFRARRRAGDEAITLAFCWAHLRRKFFDIAKDGNAPIASEALERIAALYAIEKTVKGHSADARRAVRLERSKPLVLALRAWLEHQLTCVSGKATIAEAIRYALHHWDGPTRFLDDGRIELDTNAVERGIRPIVLNRKNALFAGHDEGAENWACIASLIETCKWNGIDPQAYFADVLTRLVNLWPASRLDELMPWAWAAEQSTDSLAA
jgi:hypothetical protein